MKVYLVVIESAYDFETQTRIEAFNEFKKAKNLFNEEVKKARNEIPKKRGIDMENQEKYHSRWESGFYAKNHITIYINEVEIK